MSSSSGLSFRGFIAELIDFLENLVGRNYLEDESRKLISRALEKTEAEPLCLFQLLHNKALRTRDQIVVLEPKATVSST